MLARIDAENPITSKMEVTRAELRPVDQLQNIISVGNHWCWRHRAAQVYHHDNAYDSQKWEGVAKHKFVTAIIRAEVKLTDIDWPFTLATNLRLPSEYEITIKNGSRIKITKIRGQGLRVVPYRPFD